MNSTVEINLGQFQSALISDVKHGYDTVVSEGQISNISAMVMVGYLSSAATAFESVGDEYHSAIFKRTAIRIQKDWKEFMDAMQILFQTVDIEKNKD